MLMLRSDVDEILKKFKFEFMASLIDDGKVTSSTPRQRGVISFTLSDSLMMATCVGDLGDAFVLLSRVSVVLCTAAAAMFVALRNGLVLRGGVDIGTGVLSAQHDVYGPCIWKVHTLERCVARWPRIVLGSEISRVVRKCSQQLQHPNASSAPIPLVRLVANIAHRDTDGHLVLDWLGEEMKTLTPYTPAAIEDVRSFVESELQRYQAEGNDSLIFNWPFAGFHADVRAAEKRPARAFEFRADRLARRRDENIRFLTMPDLSCCSFLRNDIGLAVGVAMLATLCREDVM